MKIKLSLLLASLALVSCQKPAPPVASVSRSMNGQVTTTYHDPHQAFYNSLEHIFPQ